MEDKPISKSVSVSTAQQLLAALEDAGSGDTIQLAAGNYGTLDLRFSQKPFVKFSREVILRSAEPGNPAVFNSFKMHGVENLTFDRVKFDYKAAVGAPHWIKPFSIDKDCANIKITNSVFDGDLARGVSAIVDGYGTGTGISVFNAKNITISGNEFYNWRLGGVFARIAGLVVSGNDVHDVRSDGFDFVAVSKVLIEKNHMHDFAGAPNSGDHRDMFQFWTTGQTVPTTDVVIRENFLNSGSGSSTQSIFIRNQLVDQGKAGEEMFYRNILIEDNVIHNSHSHGITVGETDGLVIRNNTLLRNHASGDSRLVWVPTINNKKSSRNVTITNNILPRKLGKIGRGWKIKDNLLVQFKDPARRNYVCKLFVDAASGPDATLEDLKALPGCPIQKNSLGSKLLRQ